MGLVFSVRGAGIFRGREGNGSEISLSFGSIVCPVFNREFLKICLLS